MKKLTISIIIFLLSLSSCYNHKFEMQDKSVKVVFSDASVDTIDIKVPGFRYFSLSSEGTLWCYCGFNECFTVANGVRYYTELK